MRQDHLDKADSLWWDFLLGGEVSQVRGPETTLAMAQYQATMAAAYS